MVDVEIRFHSNYSLNQRLIQRGPSSHAPFPAAELPSTRAVLLMGTVASVGRLLTTLVKGAGVSRFWHFFPTAIPESGTSSNMPPLVRFDLRTPVPFWDYSYRRFIQDDDTTEGFAGFPAT